MEEYDISSGYAEANETAFGDDRSLLGGWDMEESSPAPGITTTVMHPRKDEAMEAWRLAHDKREAFQTALFDELSQKYKVDPRYGALMHCTCGHDQRAQTFWLEIGGHKSHCRFIQPNFLYKPTGFTLNWYKYPFRDSYMSENLTAVQWADMMDACIASLDAKQPGPLSRTGPG